MVHDIKKNNLILGHFENQSPPQIQTSLMEVGSMKLPEAESRMYMRIGSQIRQSNQNFSYPMFLGSRKIPPGFYEAPSCPDWNVLGHQAR